MSKLDLSESYQKSDRFGGIYNLSKLESKQSLLKINYSCWKQLYKNLISDLPKILDYVLVIVRSHLLDSPRHHCWVSMVSMEIWKTSIQVLV